MIAEYDGRSPPSADIQDRRRRLRRPRNRRQDQLHPTSRLARPSGMLAIRRTADAQTRAQYRRPARWTVRAERAREQTSDAKRSRRRRVTARASSGRHFSYGRANVSPSPAAPAETRRDELDGPRAGYLSRPCLGRAARGRSSLHFIVSRKGRADVCISGRLWGQCAARVR
jgi:hypothetical protein